jgi:hypothetical protein
MAGIQMPARIANDIFEAASRERARQKLGTRTLPMSMIGAPCDRKLWYLFRNFTKKPMDGRLALIFDDGNHYELKMLKWLRAAGYKIEGGADEGEQGTYLAHNGFFKGKSDGKIFGITQHAHVLEIKSANKHRFESFLRFGVKAANPLYYCQCQCYMGYGNLDRALVLVYCKDDSRVYTERLHFNRHDFQSLHERAYRIITANDLLDRAFQKADAPECRWCDFRVHCWTDEGTILADDRACGSCQYLQWKGLQPCCLHPDHPCMIQTWGAGCPDWLFLFDKGRGRDCANRKSKADISLVSQE